MNRKKRKRARTDSETKSVRTLFSKPCMIGLFFLVLCLRGSADLAAQSLPSISINSGMPFWGSGGWHDQDEFAMPVFADLPEYQIKAVFLFNFAQFVEWPEAAFLATATPFIIGILGEDPFGSYLEETVRNEKIKNRPLLVKRWQRMDEVGTCHILFVGRSEQNRLRQILANVRARHILTVSDIPGFAQNGGMIQFVTMDNKIRLRINAQAARARDLAISSKLLSLAEIVAAGKD